MAESFLAEVFRHQRRAAWVALQVEGAAYRDVLLAFPLRVAAVVVDAVDAPAVDAG